MDRSRVVVLAVLVLLPLAGLEARLVDLQALHPPESVADLDSRRATVDVVRAPRGPILDRAGRALAEDRRSFDAYLVLEEYEKEPSPLAALVGLSTEEFQHEVEKIYAKIERLVARRPAGEGRRVILREKRTPYLLKTDIPAEAAFAIELSPQLYPGAVVRESLKRVYPWRGSKAYEALYPGALPGSHVLGYLGRATANPDEFRDRLQDGYFCEGFDELIGQDGIAQLYRRSVFHEERVGRAGIELRYDEALRAKPGLVVTERRAGTGERKVTELKPAEPGSGVELTIDIEFQEEVERILAGTLPAAAVVLDPATGEVLALASNRGYDPGDFTPPGNPAKTAALEAVLADSVGKPLQSRAFANHFPLGSLFKVVTSAAGLEEKKVRPDEPLPCRGKFDERFRQFNCWLWNEYHGMHGDVTLHQALERSCNCYYYEVGKRCEMEAVLKWARAFGFGAPTGIDLPGELAGLLPRRRRSENDVLSLAIGQHELLVTPLQAAVMVSAIANGGRRVIPHLRRGSPAKPQDMGLSPETIREIRQGLTEVTHGAHGTAHRTELRNFGAAGKTSSAQAPGGRTHAWFGGYAPHAAPKYAVVTFVEHGGHGGEAAAPPAARIIEALYRRYGDPRK
jgi:penicillin-binding protein 2